MLIEELNSHFANTVLPAGVLRVLVACEESQTVCKSLRAKGHEAYSCDIQECSGGKPEWHIKDDAIKVAYDLSYNWDAEGADFFMKLVNAPIDKIAVENPICIMSTKYRKPDQIINPFQFGHPEQKKTCLWLKNLPKLKETNNVYEYMMTLPIKERTRIHWLGSNKSKERSVTYQGIADAIAEQWF
jgi:hypothetical protein